MNATIRNTIAVIAGLVIGSFVNMGIIMSSGSVIPPPEGVNPADMESLKSSMHLFQPKHFIMPFLAHAIGTLAGAFVAALIAASYKTRFAIAIGCFFLLGGIINSYLLPAPLWFIVLDLAVAYIPMALLAAKFAAGKN